MLCPAEGALIRRESGLPGLGLVLDVERFLERLAKLLPEGSPRSARPVYLRYKPGTSCLVAYRTSGPLGELDVHAVARASDAPQKLQKARSRAARPGRSSRLFVLDDCGVVVSVFPEDAGLPVLARLASPEARRALLRRLLRPRPGGAGELVRVRYKPERRWVGRVSTEEGADVGLKAHAAAGFAAGLRGSLAWVDHPRVRVPRFLGALPEHGLLAFEWIAGRALGEALLGGEAGPAELGLAGEALADLHSQARVDLPPRTPLVQARRLLSVAAALAFVQPGLAARIERLGHEIARRLEARPPGAWPTHGDFHAGQVLLVGGAAALIDLDEAVLAHPAADLGSFLAHLERDGCARRLPGEQGRTLGEALLDGYGRRRARPAEGELAVYTAAALFQLAPHFFRDRDAAWPERTEAVLDRAEAILHGRAARASSAACERRPAGQA